VLGAATTNYSRGVGTNTFMVRASVTIGYDTPWRQTHAMLEEASRRTPGIASEPPPRVFQTSLSDFYIEYRLTAWALPTEPSARAEVRSVLHANILDVFNEHGVQIMSPHYLGDPNKAKVVPPARWFDAPARPRTDGDTPAAAGEKS
jgi:small-conductance mechanosensitive channel